MTTTKQTIRELGGAAFVAKCLGVTVPAVYNWSYTGIFPPQTYLPLSELAQGKKVFLDRDLFRTFSREERANGKTQGERGGPVERGGAAEP